MTATIGDNVVDSSEESRVAMEVDFSAFGLVPFGVQYCDSISLEFPRSSHLSILTQIFGV
jgi:hypothetical protein